MMIYRDGVLWHSGTGKDRLVGNLHRLVLGANRSLANHWTGNIDHFQVFNAALDQVTISDWQLKKIDNSHPNWNNLLVAYDFDNVLIAQDATANDYLLMPSSQALIEFSDYPITGMESSANRLIVSFW